MTPTPASLVRPDYRLADNLGAAAGTVFLTGTQALIRLRADAARARRRSAASPRSGFISGYRGSPLGMVDQQAWKAAEAARRRAASRFLPAINEELGATAVLGTQRVESDPERTADGVFAMWYGKGPGVDRAGDALKHGNAYGASPHGGVARRRRRRPRLRLVVDAAPERRGVAGVAHAGASRRPTSPSTSSSGSTAGRCRASRATGSASRRSRKWSRAARPSTSTRRTRASPPGSDAAAVEARDRLRRAGRRPALPLARPAVAEDRAAPARQARRGARVREGQFDRPRHRRRAARDASASSPAARRTSTCSRCFRRLDIPLDALAARRRPHLQGRPRLPARADARSTRSPRGSSEILVVEEKAGVVEQQLRDLFYNRRRAADRDRRQARREPASRSSASSASCGRRG